MAKPPVDTYEKMTNYLKSQLRSKRFVANYQPVMIKLLLLNGNQTKQQIADELWKANGNSRELSHYMSVPVYRVLVDNGVVTKSGNVFSLILENISESEKQTLLAELESCITRQEKFAKSGYLSWEEAKPLYKKIKEQYQLKNLQEWNELVKSGKIPDNLPTNPAQFYTQERAIKKQNQENDLQ